MSGVSASSGRREPLRDGSPSAAKARKVGRISLEAVVTVDADHDVEYHLESIRAHFANSFSCYVHEFYPGAIITTAVTSEPEDG